MEIIKRGVPPPERLWRGTCSKCESVAEAFERELTKVTQDPRDGTKHSWEICPVCSAGVPSMGNYGGMLFYPVA